MYHSLFIHLQASLSGSTGGGGTGTTVTGFGTVKSVEKASWDYDNGGIGLMFGRLYRKHGIAYAMIAHAGCHIVSKLIWVLFL